MSKTILRYIPPLFSGPVLAVLIGVVCFWLALLPVHTTETNLAGYADGRLEQANGLSYIWLRPQMGLGYQDLPRFAPVNLKLVLLLARPAEAPPAILDIFETRKGVSIPLLNLAYSATKPDPQEYLIKLPASTTSLDELYIDFKSNGFRVKGDNRDLGIRISQATISVSKSGLILAVFSQPLFPATLILLLGLAWWCALAGFGRLETILLLAPVGFISGALANQLIYSSWWLLLAASLLVGTAAVWWRKGQGWLVGGDWRAPGLLLAGIFAFGGFFVFAPIYEGDFFVHREWLSVVINHGPFGAYSYSDRLNYPPGTVYQFYLYSLVARPLGLLSEGWFFKLLMGSSLLFIIGLIWWAGVKSGVRRENLVRGVLLFGFSLSLLFVPLMWAQLEGWQFGLMALALLLVIFGKPVVSVFAQAVSLLYKPQSWLILPFYAVSYLLRFGWLKAFLGGVLGVVLLVVLGGPGFAFNLNMFQDFLNHPSYAEQSDWAGAGSFNLVHLFGYDAINLNYTSKVPEILLYTSYALFGLVYLGVILVNWRRTSALKSEVGLDENELYVRRGSETLLAAGLILCAIFYFWIRMHERHLYYGLGFLVIAALYRRDLYRPALLLNLLFSLNLLYAYLPERRDPVPNNFFFWRHFLHSTLSQNILSLSGIAVCIWLGWLYLKPARDLPKLAPAEPDLKIAELV